MAGYGIINSVALKNTASAQVFDKFMQGIIHVNGNGVDESYINGSALGSQSIAIPKVALGAGDFRLLGASVNGGQFNSKDAVVSTSDYIHVPILYVYDRIETLAKIMNDKAGYDLLSAKTENLRRKITRGINALTFAVQIAATLNASAGDEADTYITEESNVSLYDKYLDANALLDEGDESIDADYFPTEMRQAFFRPSAFAKLKKEKGVILDSNLGQEMLATGVLNPFKNSEASKVEMRDGYAGEIDGVPVYKVSPILLSLAAQYCKKNGGAVLDKTAFDKIDALVCSAVGTIRGFTSTGDIDVVPAQAGQGWVLQPLVHGGCVCVSPKSVRLIVQNDFANPATAKTGAGSLEVLPKESQS